MIYKVICKLGIGMELLIRSEIKSGDIGRITYLHGVLYAKEQGYDYTFEAYVAEPLAQFAKRSNSRERIWIVELGEKVLGSIALCEVSKKEAQLRWFLVSPELRGKGIGKQLMKTLLHFAISQGYEVISLWTVKGLETARNIYISFGFILTEEVKHLIWGGIHSEQKYALELKAYNNVIKSSQSTEPGNQ
jgi:GNAT superfamily N-acetyltransferase